LERNQAGSNSELTKVLHGAAATTSARLETINGAKKQLDVCDDALGTVALVQFDAIKNAIRNASKVRGVRIRFITEIAPENLKSCKELMDFVELRHLEGVRGNFAVSEKQYYAFASMKEAKIPTETIHSNVRTIVEQNQYLFEVLWNNAQPGVQRIREIEEGVSPIETKIVSGRENVSRALSSFLQKIACQKGDPADCFLFAASDERVPEDSESNLELVSRMKSDNPSLRILLITDVQRGNLDYVKEQMEAGIDVRHIERNKVSFAVSRDGYIASSSEAVNTTDNSSVPNEIIWSNNPDVISQAVQMFEMMWETGVSASQRIHQLEQGIDELGETKIVRTFEESTALGRELMNGAREEILIILASERTITRNSEMYEEMMRRCREKGLRIRILAPVDLSAGTGRIFRGAPWRQIPPMNVGFAIYDRSKMLITQYADPEAIERADAFVTNIFTTNRHTIDGIVSVFDALWNVTELREREMEAKERESRARRQAQLLQDILTHDIRNYNQVSLLTAELIKEESAGNIGLESLVDSLLKSIEGSTTLVDRAKSLGRIAAEEKPRLHRVDLISSIEAALELVRRATPNKEIRFELRNDAGDSQGRTYVTADDLLNEVFSNLFSNSAKYTEGNLVYILVEISKTKELEGEDRSMLKISVSDKGRGIPEEIRENIFNRYLIGARGSGLGLSIVHALVVDRYKGSVSVSDRNGGRGTTVDVYLPE